MARTRLIQRKTLTNSLRRDIRQFEDQARTAASNAAERASAKSRNTFLSRLNNPPRQSIPSRPSGKRPSTQGTFADHIVWNTKGSGMNVALEVGRLEAAAPYWLIQEIGTGKSAAINPGSSGSGTRAPGGISVKSQKGRVIPKGLVWSGNNPPTDQLVPGAGPRITIRREIKGKGYVRIGGNAGFRLYERELEEAFRRAFGHHPK